MADVDVNLYVTQKEYNNNNYHASNLVKNGLIDALDHQSLSHDITVVNDPQDVGGQDGDCGGDPWSNWSSRVSNGNIPSKARSNLLITHRGYYDDANGDGCAYVGGKAAIAEGGKALNNVNSASDLPRFSTSTNRAHLYLCVSLMEIAHNYGGRHTTSTHHGADIQDPNGVECWTPVVMGYEKLEGETNECGTEVLDCYCGDKDRYYSDCMAGEFTS